MDMNEHSHSYGEQGHAENHSMQGMNHEMHSMQAHPAHGLSMGGHMGNLKQKFWISLIIAIPIILLSPMMGLSLPFQFTFPGSGWVVLVLASFLFFYGGMPFLQGAKIELKGKNPGMMTLIAMGITVAYIYSLYAFISNHLFPAAEPKMDFFWELATLIIIMLLGHWIEMRTVGNANDTLQKMAELLPGSAHLVGAHGNVTDVPLQEIQIGQQVIVKAGEKISADGIVISGESTVNESMVTGESRVVKKAKGNKVIGGSVNGNGSLVIEVTGTGESGFLAQVMRLVSRAQQKKSRSERLSDKVAKILFYVAVSAGIVAFVVWYILTKNLNISLERLVTVLIIACPHALGLAIPLVVARSTSLGAQNGLLIRNRDVLEKVRKIAVVTMDKTGTLTEGNFHVSLIQSLSDEYTDNSVLGIMAAIEAGSSHPLATGILDEVQKRNIAYPKAENVTVISGVGLNGVVDGKDIKITKAGYLDENGFAYDKDLFENLAAKGNSISYLLVDNAVAGLVAQGDEIKPEAQSMISGLKQLHVVPVMLTGDNEAYAHHVALQLGIGEVHANLFPQDKEEIIASFQQQGKPVMMVGDGVNDAPALARSEIGVAIGAGTDIAIDSADIVLVKSNPADILHFFTLAKNTVRKMIQNLWWGAGYNIIAIPLAAGVLAPMGIILSPAVGAILMSVSTIVVAINAMTLKLQD
jgi:Cu2+-exporting ATPase